MALLVPDVGEAEMLGRILNNTTPDDLVLRLYTNDLTPGESNVIGDYTEAAGNGYSAITLSGASWTITTTAGSTEGTYAQQDFVFIGGPVTVYGYHVTNNAGTILMYAERFIDGPYNIPVGGGTIKITPTIQLE